MSRGKVSRRFLFRGAFQAVCCLAFSKSIAWAQDSQPIALSIGDPLVRGDNLRPFKNQWHLSVTTADGKKLEDAGTWTDEMTAVTVDGRVCWKRTQFATYKAKNGEVRATSKTINTFDRRTLAPVYREFEKRVAGYENTRVKISFGEKSLKIESTEQGHTEVKELTTSPAFDFYGGVYAVLWAALPLKQGFTATFPSYTEGEHPEEVRQVTYKVTGRESVDAGPRGKVNAWVIESDTMIGLLKYWISEDAPYIIRMDFTQKNGALWVLTMA
jgi:hypothetical protein